MKVLLSLSLTGLFGGVVVRAATESSATTRKLDQTPTWAVASVCSVKEKGGSVAEERKVRGERERYFDIEDVSGIILSDNFCIE